MSSWGGKREGAGSGGQRPGAGRPRKIWDSGGAGTVWIMELFINPGGFPEKPRRWQILSVSDDEIEFQDMDSEEIIVLRKPDELPDDD